MIESTGTRTNAIIYTDSIDSGAEGLVRAFTLPPFPGIPSTKAPWLTNQWMPLSPGLAKRSKSSSASYRSIILKLVTNLNLYTTGYLI